MMTPTMQTVTVRTATASDEDRALAVLALAFVSDPVSRTAWSDPHVYVNNFVSFARAFGGRAFGAGSAHIADDFAGVALWLPPGVHPDDETMGALMVQTMPEERLAQMSPMMEQMSAYHPAEPHWYLPMIGVDPMAQGQGVGSALLAHATAGFDREGVVAYLESSNPKNVPLYRRHGFEVIGEIQVSPSATLNPMVRKPR